ncbi:MAG: hypothetical protein ACLGHO_11285 [Gammaproteobacteria bacterium]
MDALHTLARRARIVDARQNATALGMLAVSIFALYSNMIMLVIVPLVWVGYRIGKEVGRQQAHEESADVPSAALFPDQDR